MVFQRGEFKWDKGLQGLMLGAFFWGYMVLQVFGGTISEKYGAKKVIAFGMVPVAVLTILTPVCVRANPYLFMVVRILIGVGEVSSTIIIIVRILCCHCRHVVIIVVIIVFVIVIIITCTTIIIFLSHHNHLLPSFSLVTIIITIITVIMIIRILILLSASYSIACLCYHCHSSTAPSYVTDMLHKKPLHTRNTRSSSYTMPLLNRPAHSKATLGDRSFSFASSSVWNSIPNDVKCAPSLSSFKSRLKTYLFHSVYKD